MAEDVVGRGRLLDPVRIELGQLAHPVDGLVDAPALVGVDGDARARAGGAAGHLEAADVGLDVESDLELQHRESVGDRGGDQALDLVVVVAEPARPTSCRRAGRRPRSCRFRSPCRVTGVEEGQRVVGCECVVDVGEVDLADDLGRASSRRAPATGAGHRGGHRRSHAALTTAPMAMCMTPFSGPSQRSCPSQVSSREQAADVGDEIGDVPPDDVGGQRPHRGAGDVVAPPGGEEQRVPAQVGVVRAPARRRRRSSRARGSWRPSRRSPREVGKPHVEDVERG